MSDAIFVSILITTFNRADLICKAIDSALAQDYPGHLREVIVVDDGSTDGTRDIVPARYGDRIRFFHKANGGINSASQFAMEQARGEVIAQLDSDDYWYPDKLSKTVPLFETPDLVAVFHDLDVFRAGEVTTGHTCWGGLRLTLAETPCDALGEYLAGHPIPAYTSGALWRRSALAKILPFPEGLWGFNDAYCARNIVFHGRACALRTPLGAYLLHDSNDYGGGNFRKNDPVRIERALREARIMSEAFNRRCEQFGRKPSAHRLLVQKLALAEAHVTQKLLTGKGAALAWLARNDLRLPGHARLQLTLSLLLPARAAVFIKNRIIGRFVALD